MGRGISKDGVVGGIIALLILVGGLMAYSGLTKSSTSDALLLSVDGDVSIVTGSTTITAVQGMRLKVNEVVKTGQGRAIIVLRESMIVTLDSDSELRISSISPENVEVQHTQGRTWNKFTGLTGMKNYKATTPNTVAAVRGTTWEQQVSPDQIIVLEGKVSFQHQEERVEVGSLEKYTLKDSTLVQSDPTPEDLERLKKELEVHVTTLKKMRWNELRKNSVAFNVFKQRFGVTEDEIKASFNEHDEAESFDPEQIKKDAPIQSEILDKILAITEQIREARAQLE